MIKAGINVWELIELANKHPRVNILQPGCGVGGHCIAVDPWFIVSDYPEQAQLIKRARETNDYKADWCANKVLETCQRFVEKNEREPIVACMGLAFKPNIDDLRESPAKYIASRIISESRRIIGKPMRRRILSSGLYATMCLWHCRGKRERRNWISAG